MGNQENDPNRSKDLFKDFLNRQANHRNSLDEQRARENSFYNEQEGIHSNPSQGIPTQGINRVSIAPQRMPQQGSPAIAPQRMPQQGSPAIAPQRMQQQGSPAIAPQRMPQQGSPAIAPQRMPQQGSPAIAPQRMPQQGSPAIAPQRMPQQGVSRHPISPPRINASIPETRRSIPGAFNKNPLAPMPVSIPGAAEKATRLQRLSPQNPIIPPNLSNPKRGIDQSSKNQGRSGNKYGFSMEKRQTETKKFLDFQAFQEEREKAKMPQEISKSPIVNINSSGNKGTTKAKCYQDHRFGKGIPSIFREEEPPQEPEEEVYINKRLFPVERSVYQDHRLGDALSAPLPEIAGQGAKYQDHRLGPGIKS